MQEYSFTRKILPGSKGAESFGGGRNTIWMAEFPLQRADSLCGEHAAQVLPSKTAKTTALVCCVYYEYFTVATLTASIMMIAIAVKRWDGFRSC